MSVWCGGCSGVDNGAHAVGPGLEGTAGGSVRDWFDGCTFYKIDIIF